MVKEAKRGVSREADRLTVSNVTKFKEIEAIIKDRQIHRWIVDR